MASKRNRHMEPHFRVRLAERYDMYLTAEEYVRVIQIIQNRRHADDEYYVRHVASLTNTRSLVWVGVRNREFLAIYSGSRKSLITALPPGAEADYENGGSNEFLQEGYF